jgi:4-hydroxy-tetrahydrodipicolinate synthase
MSTDLVQGVVVPMVTPMDAPGVPSARASRNLLDAVHGAGVDGLMLLGSNGEGPLLPTSALGPFVADVVAYWRTLGGGPVHVNVTAAGTAEVLERADAVAAARPDGLVVSPPIYFHHRDDEVIAHYAALSQIGTPVIAYNIPRYSTPLTAPVLDALLAMQHVVGLKDSSGDAAWLSHVLETARDRRPSFGIGQGAESQLVSGLRQGAHGIVPGIANIAPEVAVALVAAVRDGDEDTADQLQSEVNALCGIHRVHAGVAAVKAVLSARGVCPPYLALPLVPCTDEERADILAIAGR